MPKSLTGANEKLQHSLSTRKIKSTVYTLPKVICKPEDWVATEDK